MGALLVVGALVGGPSPYPALTEQNAAALARMKSDRAALDQEIDSRQCTVEAKAKAGTIKPVEGTEFDGMYAGKGSADSWCTPPILSLTVASGKVTGTLTADTSAYEAKGQLYDNGEVSLYFKRRGTRNFTDDADGQVKGDVLSFAAKLDPSPKKCSYRFAVTRKA